jgi:putative transposase
MDSIADVAAPEAALAIPRFEDGFVNMQELLRQLAESVVNEIMSAEADQLCEVTGNSRNGYRDRRLTTCVGVLNLRIPKLRTGSFFPGDVIERYQRVDRAIVAAVSEMYATGTSTRKVQKVAAAMGIERLSKDQVSAICEHLDSEVEELVTRPLGALRTPYLWIDATYVKCRRERRVASTAVVTAIGCDEDGWRHVLGIGVVDTESYDSWLAFLRGVRSRGVAGVQLVTSDAHEGLRRAIEEVFQGAAWQRCVVHLMRDCARAASGSRSLSRRVSRIVAPVFRLKDEGAVRAAYHLAIGMLESCCRDAARILEEAEPDALAYLDFPSSHWKRLRTNNVQERTNREIKRRSRVVQVFPSVASLERLAGAVMCDQDEAWSEARYFSEKVMAELYDEKRGRVTDEPPTPERMAEWRVVAQKAIDASLELADELEAA